MKNLFLLSLITLLVACGSGSGSGNNDETVTPPEAKPSPQPTPEPSPQPTPEPEPFVPENSSISSLSLVDASGSPLANASVTVSQQSTSSIALLSSENIQLLTTDENGVLVLPTLMPGRYSVSVTLGDIMVSTILEILPNNATESAIVVAPVVVTENSEGGLQVENLEGKEILASLTGVIYGGEGVLENAQIELSGGADTNGAVVSAVTNVDGEFALIINASLNKLPALREATIRIIREGFQTQYIPFNVAEIANAQMVTAITGLNYSLQQKNETVDLFYQEDFEQLSDGAVCGSWSAINPEIAMPPFVAGLNSTNLWHNHTRGLSITNRAVVNGLVSLAPDDQSGGRIPDPQGNSACWYGQSESGDGQGNFFGDSTLNSLNSGAIVSPLIDLTNASAPLALDFNTWWEIEALNPSRSNLMTISVSTDNGGSWNDIARLNPKADSIVFPTDLPHSNRGFNKAPLWLSQEPISLSEFAGQQIKLRFAFTKNERSYNGFRGWLVDDIRIYQGDGTFPRYTESERVVHFDNIFGGFSTIDFYFVGEVIVSYPIQLKLFLREENGAPREVYSETVMPGPFEIIVDYQKPPWLSTAEVSAQVSGSGGVVEWYPVAFYLKSLE